MKKIMSLADVKEKSVKLSDLINATS